jgi:N-acetylglucosamine transport system permease protein
MTTNTQRQGSSRLAGTAFATPAHREPASRARRSDVRMFSRLGQVALIIWAVIVIAPILWTFLASFKNTTEIFSSPWTLPAHLRIENWSRAWTKAHVGRYFLNSVLVVGLGTFGTMLLGSMAAYVLARYKFWGNRIVYYLFVSGLAFPPVLAIVPLFFIVKQAGNVPLIGQYITLNTYGGLILVYIAYSLPFTVFFLAAFFKTLPSSIAEAAMIDGASHSRLFFRIMLPMARPGMVSVAIFNIIGQWAQYLLPVVLMTDASKYVLTQGIATINTNAGYEADWSGLFAAVGLAIIPMIIVYAIFQRQIQAGLTAGAVK